MKGGIGATLLAFFLAWPLTIFWPAAAAAKTVLIDDSGTQALEPSVGLHWKNVAPSRRSGGNLMIGSSTIRVRLNVMPWLHRTGRIYLNLPAQAPGPLTLSWTTQGHLLPGQLQSGNRLLIYTGAITAPVLEDTLTVQYGVDGALVQRAFPVTFHFEMDEI
jgi:hypothetical protein